MASVAGTAIKSNSTQIRHIRKGFVIRISIKKILNYGRNNQNAQVERHHDRRRGG
jgi:hypothetical protein